MIEDWMDMKWWNTGEHQVVKERLDDLKAEGKLWNPGTRNLYAALRSVKPRDVRVIIMGQDPYPNPELCTGFAFSIPPSIPVGKFPPTLKNIFLEYHKDLGYDMPNCGDLTPWAKQGVLLWNCIPTCLAWQSASHRWPEYEFLTQEILTTLSTEYTVVVFLGTLSAQYRKYLNEEFTEVLHYSYPSPLSVSSGKKSFHNSRLFSTINAKLRDQGKELIQWRLPSSKEVIASFVSQKISSTMPLLLEDLSLRTTV